LGDGGAEQAGVGDGQVFRLGEVEDRHQLVPEHRREQSETRLDDRLARRQSGPVVRPAHGQLGYGREAETRAEPDLGLVLAKAQDGSSAGLVDLNETHEDTICRAAWIVRHEECQHRVESVHRLRL
jgi:hypothetical protein